MNQKQKQNKTYEPYVLPFATWVYNMNPKTKQKQKLNVIKQALYLIIYFGT